MRQLTVKMIPYDELSAHARFVFIENGKADEVIDEQITSELCVKLYRGIICDDKGHKYGHKQYTLSERAMIYMLDTLTSRF